MSLFEFFRRPGIMDGLLQYDEIPDALLLDVRSPAEYKEGRIPGSQNVPIQSLDKVHQLTENKDTPIFVYCHSGSRSTYAALMLRDMGFRDVRNLGGMAAYRGRVERTA